MGVTKEEMQRQKIDRLGLTKTKYNGEVIKIVNYIDSQHVTVEFQDEHKEKVVTSWDRFCKGTIGNPATQNKVGLVKTNNQGCLMKIVEFNNKNDIVVEFQDEYKFRKKSAMHEFYTGGIKNPYYPSVYGVGIIGEKYKTSNNSKMIKEYTAWAGMLLRCYGEHKVNIRYQDVTCCKEWLYFPNFYEWLHSQENFEKWLNGDKWDLDKDILFKGNKIYSPETCCLVPHNVNSLFIKSNALRGDLPIGVGKRNDRDGYTAKVVYGKYKNKAKITSYSYPTPEDAFYLGYKPYKEKYIQRIAQEEYELGNITKACYEAMMNYQVEITD